MLVFKSLLCLNHILFNTPTCILIKNLKLFYPIILMHPTSYFRSRSGTKSLSLRWCRIKKSWCWTLIWIQHIGSVTDPVWKRIYKGGFGSRSRSTMVRPQFQPWFTSLQRPHLNANNSVLLIEQEPTGPKQKTKKKTKNEDWTDDATFSQIPSYACIP